MADYQFCRGSLTSIAVEKKANGVVMSDIALGGLVIGAETTVAQLAAAVIANNAGWEEHDQITFFHAKQTRDAFSGVPRATMDSWKVVLDKNDETALLTQVSALGFTSVSTGTDGQYVLGMREPLANAGCAWVHSRQDKGGALKVGSQRLFVENEMLTYYRSDAAKKAAFDSYGGVNTRAVYLKPESSVATVATDSNSGSSQNGNSGDNAAGGDQQPTTPASGDNPGNTDGGDDLDKD